MLPLTSLFLDIVRFSAAVGVLVSHVFSGKFGREIPILVSLGHACVAVFFVLSGYVIAWVADTRETSGLVFMKARLARLYSVLCPALILTLCLDPISRALNPANFATLDLSSGNDFYNAVSTLLFINQSYGVPHDFLSNSPVWSLGYEMSYYVLFSMIVFLRSIIRLILIIALLLIQGPAIWILAPIWLLGVAAYYVFGRRQPKAWETGVVIVAAIGLVAASPWLMKLQTRFYSLKTPDWLNLGHSNQFIFFYVVGCLVTASIVVVQSLDGRIVLRSAWLKAAIRETAASTFSIYLFHFPILVFIYALTGYDRTKLGNSLIALFVTLGCAVALSHVSERRKRAWSRLISGAVDTVLQVMAPILPSRLR